MKRVFVCSPFAGDIEGNTKRAIEYCRAEIEAGNVPFAPHLHNPQILSEHDPAGRRKGIELGLNMLEVCDELHVYGDAVSLGMKCEILMWLDFCLLGKKKICGLVWMSRQAYESFYQANQTAGNGVSRNAKFKV